MLEELNEEQRLTILQDLDLERRWYSIDDKRICTVCERIISGREIQITGTPGNYSLRCPTEGCPSNFSHWFLFRLPPDPNEKETSADGIQGNRFRFNFGVT